MRQFLRQFLIGLGVFSLICLPYTLYPDQPDWYKLTEAQASCGNGGGPPSNGCDGGNGIIPGNSGAGGVGGAATSTNTNTNTNTNSATSSSSSSSHSSSKSTSSSSATGIGIGGSSSAAGGSSTASTGGVSTDVKIDVPRQAPPAVAPGLTSAGTGVCLGSIAIGGSTPFGGLSFGVTKVDKGCERRSGAALLFQFGYPDAALRLLMNDSEIKEAMYPSVPKPSAAMVEPTTVQASAFQGN